MSSKSIGLALMRGGLPAALEELASAARAAAGLQDEHETDALARALCLRGIVGTFSEHITFQGHTDDYHRAWEELPEALQRHWLLLASVVHRITATPSWDNKRGGGGS